MIGGLENIRRVGRIHDTEQSRGKSVEPGWPELDPRVQHHPRPGLAFPLGQA